MLSKSAARTFFLIGTILSFGVFIVLTFDTIIRWIPEQTKSKDINEHVIAGKELWSANNCMGCHTLFGEGAYYAPELTKVYERRGEAFIRAMLVDPEKMYPGQRKMVKYNFSKDEIDNLVAFFKWAGNVDLNGFPPKPNLNTNIVAVPSGEISEMGKRPLVFNQMCIACHQLQGQGGNIGPALDGVGDRLDRETISKRLKDPSLVKADTKMPKLPLSDGDIVELSTFLSLLKK